jgi:CheY-like chemotaxis protein
MAHILVVDDQKQIRSLLRTLLESIGHEVIEASSGREGLCHYRTARPDLVITDMQMPDMNGAEMIEHLRHIVPSVKIIVLSGSHSGIRDAIRLVGSQHTIRKPFSLEQFWQTVQAALLQS